MKIRLTDPITGKTRTQRATLMTDHPQCSYGQPVLVAGGIPLSVANAVFQDARVVEPPKRADQRKLLRRWIANADLMTGEIAENIIKAVEPEESEDNEEEGSG